MTGSHSDAERLRQVSAAPFRTRSRFPMLAIVLVIGVVVGAIKLLRGWVG